MNPKEDFPKVDVTHLRQLTKQAIQRDKEKEFEKLLDIQAENDQKAKHDQLFASTILANLFDKCKKEADRGRSQATIMRLQYGRDYTFQCGFHNTLSSHQLTGPGAIVWNYLQENNLNAIIEFWHDGIGVQSGFNIIVHW